jgi:hypothetical protein
MPIIEYRPVAFLGVSAFTLDTFAGTRVTHDPPGVTQWSDGPNRDDTLAHEDGDRTSCRNVL